MNLSNSFIIFSILKNQPKYFLCLNSSRDIVKIYTKKNFPAQIGRRLNDQRPDNVNNKFDEFTFKCNNKESLLMFSILDNRNDHNKCLENFNSQNKGEYYFFYESKEIYIYPDMMMLVA